MRFLPSPRRYRPRWFVPPMVLATLATAEPVTAQQGGFGSIAGIAADSLHEHALVGALVTIEGLGRSAISDSASVFRIDTVPAGEWRLTAYHPLLDSLRISLVTPVFTIAPEASLNVVIAVPSAASLQALKCGSDTAAAIIGTVSVADDPAPPRDGHVELSWMETMIGRGIGIRHTPRSARAPINEHGTFQLCGIPPDVIGDLVAVTTTDTSAALTVSLLESPLVVLDLVLPGSDVEAIESPPDPMPMAAEPGVEPSRAVLRRGQAVITGTVRTAEGRAVAAARVSVHGAAGAAITDTTGTFTLRDQPSGTGLVVVRKLGLPMVELPVTLSISRPNEIHVRMPSDIRVLSEIVVTARRDAELARVGFLSRKQRRPGSYFLGPEEMKLMANRLSLAHVLGSAPNLRFQNGAIVGRPGGVSNIPQGPSVTMQSGRCIQYLVDGAPWESRGGAPTAWLRPEDIAAIEVYRSDEAPADLPFASIVKRSGEGSPCEVVVLWTRWHVRMPLQ